MKDRVTPLQTPSVLGLRISLRRLGTLVAATLLVAAGVGSLWRTLSASPAPEDAWVMHYFKIGVDADLEPYQDIVRQLPEGSSLTVVVPDEATEAYFRTHVPGGRPVRFVRVASRFSPWARDRYLLFERRGKLVCLSRAADRIRVELRGDVDAGAAIAKLVPGMVVEHSDLAPVGGDAILLDDVALVGSESLQRAYAAGRFSPGALKQAHEWLLGREPVAVDTASVGPFQLHLDMVVAHAGGRRLVVGDPRLAASVFGERKSYLHPRYGQFHEGANLRAAAALDRIAQALESRGFEVSRAPVLFGEPTMDMPATVLSYTNVQLAGDHVFLPTYGISALDGAASEGWRALGLVVKPVRCNYAVVQGGAVRCLTNRIPPAPTSS